MGVDPDAAPEPVTEYTYVVITDTSAELNSAGTPGADICGVAADCGGEVALGSVQSFEAGMGQICGQENVTMTDCSSGIARNDPAAATDDGTACEPVEVDPNTMGSCYVSLGQGGTLVLGFE